MEQVIDTLVAELKVLVETEDFQDIMDVREVFWGDPGFVSIDDYPYLYVDINSDGQSISTVGRAGYDVREATISIGLVINVADFFDPSVQEEPGLRPLVRAMSLIRKLFARLSKTSLDGTVRSVKVNQTNYVPDIRNETYVKVALTTLVVQKQYAHEE